MRPRRPTALLLALLAASPALARSPKPVPKAAAADEKVFPTGVNWQLVDINGKSVGDGPTLQVDSTYRGSGFGGCNTYSAALYPIKGQRLAMGPIALTKKACDAAHAALERSFLGTLHSGPTWDLAGDDLVVKGGPATLRFRRGL